MRPAGDVRLALLGAVQALVPPDDSQAPRPTLREMAHHAQVGLDAARRTVDNMCRTGQLRVAGTRRVDYRNRPVAEYEPAPDLLDQDARHGAGWVDLGRIVGGWAR